MTVKTLRGGVTHYHPSTPSSPYLPLSASSFTVRIQSKKQEHHRTGSKSAKTPSPALSQTNTARNRLRGWIQHQEQHQRVHGCDMLCSQLLLHLLETKLTRNSGVADESSASQQRCIPTDRPTLPDRSPPILLHLSQVGVMTWTGLYPPVGSSHKTWQSFLLLTCRARTAAFEQPLRERMRAPAALVTFLVRLHLLLPGRSLMAGGAEDMLSGVVAVRQQLRVATPQPPCYFCHQDRHPARPSGPLIDRNAPARPAGAACLRPPAGTGSSTWPSGQTGSDRIGPLTFAPTAPDSWRSRPG
eukprot:765450-Hanusia_phi.AAC.4